MDVKKLPLGGCEAFDSQKCYELSLKRYKLRSSTNFMSSNI